MTEMTHQWSLCLNLNELIVINLSNLD